MFRILRIMKSDVSTGSEGSRVEEFYHMTSRIDKLLAGENKPTLPPIASFGSALHQIAGDDNLGSGGKGRGLPGRGRREIEGSGGRG